MLIININTKSLVIDITRMASLQNDVEFEWKDKRDKDGKFARGERNDTFERKRQVRHSVENLKNKKVEKQNMQLYPVR